MSDMLGLSVEAVGGHLIRVWSWATDQVIEGNAPGVTEKHLDRIACVTGMGAALACVGWITFTDTGATFPNWDRHLAQGAKARALTALRVQKSRNGASVTDALPEKRREEKSVNTPPSPQGDGVAAPAPKAEKSPPKLIPDFSPQFLAFWNAYPTVRRQDKQKCWKRWQADFLDREKASAVVTEGLHRWKKCHQWTKDGGQFVCNPYRWLMNRMYLENPPTAPIKEFE
jgi:hypothetical protein